MSFGFEYQPRWVLDTSSVFDFSFNLYLRKIVSNMPRMLELKPDFCEGKDYVDNFDRPFIFPPPCWSELKVGLEVLTRLKDPWAEEVQKTLELLLELVRLNVMTPDWGDSMENSEGGRAERKLWWLKFVGDHLERIGKRMALVSENPMLLLRASIAGITNCSAEEKLHGNVPRELAEIWTDDYRSTENTLIVDKHFLASDQGAQLNTEIPTHHAREDQSFRLFLTKEVQKFAQEYQYNQINYLNYPFSFCAPEHAEVNQNPDHPQSPACSLAKNGCKVVEHVVESASLLAKSDDFARSCLWWIIGEPFWAETGDDIYLNQVLGTSRLFIISDDQEWAENIRTKIVRLRPNSAPAVLDMNAAFEKFGLKRTIGDVAKDEDSGADALEAPSTSDTSSGSIETDSSGLTSALEGDTSHVHCPGGIP